MMKNDNAHVEQKPDARPADFSAGHALRTEPVLEAIDDFYVNDLRLG